MSSGTIGRWIIHQTDSRIIVEQLRRPTHMERISVSKQHTGKPVYPGPVQILADHALVTPLIPAVEQPIRISRLQVNSCARAEIEDCDLCGELFGPVRVFHVKMSAGNVREDLHDSQNQLCQKPVGIIEDHSDSRQQRR